MADSYIAGPAQCRHRKNRFEEE